MDDFLVPAEAQEFDNGGFDAAADDFGAPAPAAASFSTGGGGAAASPADTAASSASSPLASFTAKFRATAEEKDAKEREAKAARKAAGKQSLKKLLAERKVIVDARKSKNREDDEASARGMIEAMQGESWARVVSLIDVHAAASGAAAAGVSNAAGEKKSKHGHGHKGEGGHGDTSRMKDVLIGLKSKPLAAGGGL